MARNSALFDGFANVILVSIRSCAVDMTIALSERRKDDVLDSRITRVSLKGAQANCRDFVAVVEWKGGCDSGERWHVYLMAVMRGGVYRESVGQLKL